MINLINKVFIKLIFIYLSQMPEFQSLNERGKVFIANIMINPHEKRTYLKSSKNDWNQIKFDNPIYNVSVSCIFSKNFVIL